MNFEIINLNRCNIRIQKPVICHFCDKGIDPKTIKYFYYHYYSEINIIVAFQCPICEEVLFAKYQISSFDYIPNELNYYEIIGGHKVYEEFADEIKELSPNFISCFNEAYAAEQSGCKQIVGVGYRRSLEFLFKDYAIYIDYEKKDQIEKMSLSDCIEKYSTDEEMKNLLLRSAWIGNDYTHYKNWHKDISINDLKELVLLSVDSILTQFKKKNYIQKIKSSK